MIIVYLTLGVSLFVSLVSYMLVWYQACADGHAEALSAASGGRPRLAIARLVAQSFLSQLLAILGLAYLALPGYCLKPLGRGGPPVLLVHGLYHSAGAWLLFRRRLAALGVPGTRACSFNTYTKTVDELTDEVARRIREFSESHPDRRVALVGHSLGGMLIRAALLAHPELEERLSAVVLLGAPHHGSRLSVFGLGRSARFLAYEGDWVRRLNATPTPKSVKTLSLYTIWDNMVLPASSLLPPAGAGWRGEAVGRVNHVGLLFHRPTAERTARFLLEACTSA